MATKTALKKKVNIQEDHEIRERIVQSRVRLLLKHPFFGNLATRLKLKNADDWCPTAATDGLHLFYNREFISPLTSDELDFLIAHEVMHCVYDHMERREGRQPQIWNMATDYVINGQLVREGLGKMPKEGLHDPKYYDKNSDEIYTDLKKNQVEIKLTLDMHLDGERLEVVINKLHQKYDFPIQGLMEQKRINQSNTTQGIIFSISSAISNPEEASIIIKGMLSESQRCRSYESKFNYEE